MSSPKPVTPNKDARRSAGPKAREHAAGEGGAPAAQPASATLTLPHPLACAPRRPPRWVRRAPRRDVGAQSITTREGWRDPRVRTAPDGGPMRINFTYRNSFMTSADFSPTIGRDVYAEGPYEGIYRSILTTDQDTAEFQFQIGTVTWTTKKGEKRERTLDGGRIDASGREKWFELKAHESYFADPDIKASLEAVEEALAPHDIELERIDGSKLLEPVRLRTVHDVLRHRNVPFDQIRDVNRALAAISREGGAAPVRLVAERLNTSPRQARAMLCAMLIRRAVVFAVDQPLTGDTVVRAFRRPNRRLTRLVG